MGIFVYVYKNEKDKSLELVNFVCLTVRATYLDPLLLEFSMFLSFGHTSFLYAIFLKDFCQNRATVGGSKENCTLNFPYRPPLIIIIIITVPISVIPHECLAVSG